MYTGFFSNFISFLHNSKKIGSTTDFLTPHFLNCIYDSFGLDQVSISKYNETGEFVDIVSGPKLLNPIFREKYISDYQPLDPFASTLNRLAKDNKLYVFKSTDVLQDADEIKTYNTICHEFGQKYSIAIVFHGFHLAFQKNGNADFTNAETAAIRYIGQLIYSRFKYLKQQEILHHINEGFEPDNILGFLSNDSKQVELMTYTNLQSSDKCHLLRISESHDTSAECLTKQEQTIYHLLIQGKNATEISDELYCSIHTVRTHMKHIYRKMNVNSQKSLISNYYHNY